MSVNTNTPNQAEKLINRAILMVGVVFVLVVAAFGTYYVKDRYFQPSVSLVDNATMRAEDAVRNAPDDVQARLALADAYLGKKMYDQAIAQYEEALRLSEDHSGALLGLARAHEAKGDSDTAIVYFTKIVDLFKDDEYKTAYKGLNVVHYELGKIYLKRDQLDEAIDEFREAIIIDQTDADSMLLAATAYEKKESFGEAVFLYNMATRFDIRFEDAYKGLARAYRGVGEEQRALYAEAMVFFANENYDETIKRLEELKPSLADFADLHAGLGMSYEIRRQYDKAIEAYERVVQINPGHRLAQANLRALKSR